MKPIVAKWKLHQIDAVLCRLASPDDNQHEALKEYKKSELVAVLVRIRQIIDRPWSAEETKAITRISRKGK